MNTRLMTPIHAALVAAFAMAAAPVAAQDSFGAPPQQQQQQQPQPQPQPSYNTYPALTPQPYANPAPAPRQDNGQLARLVQMEQQDLGVAPTAQLHSGAMHGPTPASIPGGRLVTTPELVQLMQDPNAQALVFDVLGGPQSLPNAIPVVPASQPGNFQDQTQQQFGQFLQQTTQGRKDRPMVFYCQSTQCWMSYNAALRAINLGYTRVLWYRGGVEAWQQAGGPLQSPGQGGPSPQGGGAPRT